MSNTKQIAMEAELRFASEFVRKGWNVFLPFGEDGSVDLLIHKDGDFKKVQVKASKPKNGALICKLRSTNNWQDKRYTLKDVDLMALYDYENKKGYLIPMKKVVGNAQFSIRILPPKNFQKSGLNLDKDYIYF